MIVRFALSALVLSGAGVAAPIGAGVDDGGPAASAPWLGSRSAVPRPQAQEPSFGSSVPCAVPLEWRIADVDPRFELEDSSARVAMERATELWERAVDRELFSHEPEGGLPVRFVYDDRQALLQVRRDLQREIQDAGRDLEARRAEIADLRDAFESARAAYEERRAVFERRMASHDAEVRRWNERGGAPDSVRAELLDRSAELQEERRALERQRQELQAVQEWFRAETDRLNQRIRERNRRVEDLERRFPATATEAGRYGESVRRRNGEVVSVDREIRVFRFDGLDELVLLLAHELGHALGLGHSGVEGSVMHAVSGAWSDTTGVAGLHERDVEMLAERCPDLRR